MKSKVDSKYLKQLKSKLKEQTGKTILQAKPREIKKAFAGTVAVRGNLKAIIYERNRLMRKKK